MNESVVGVAMAMNCEVICSYIDYTMILMCVLWVWMCGCGYVYSFDADYVPV